jgi:hypothetical protein
MAKHDIQMLPKASGKLSQVLGPPKDVVPHVSWSTIDRRDGGLANDSRSIMLMVRTRAEENSSVAKHLLNNAGHVITPEDLSLVKRVDHPQHLNAWKSIIIRKNDKKQFLNEDYGNITN